MKRNMIRETKSKYILPLNQYKVGNLNRATKAFLDSLSLNTKQRMFPKEFLYKLVNSNMTNKEKITSLIVLKNLPKAVREKIFGTMSSYSNKILTKTDRNKYYNNVLKSPSINNKRVIYLKAANKARKKVIDIALSGALDEELQMIKENKRFKNVELKILKTGYFGMPELKELYNFKKSTFHNKIEQYKMLHRILNGINNNFHIIKKYIKKYDTSNQIILNNVYDAINSYENYHRLYSNFDLNDHSFLFIYYIFGFKKYTNHINSDLKNKLSHFNFYTLNANYVKKIFNEDN